MGPSIDGFTRLASTEALEDEKAVTTIGFFCRARAFFTVHGIRQMRPVHFHPEMRTYGRSER